MAARTGSAKWQGNFEDGSGTVTIGNGTYTGNYSFSSRFEDGDGTDPESMIAAAHAACFTMALNKDLHEHGHDVTSVETTANVQLRQIDGKLTIAKIELATEGVARDMDEAHFLKHAEAAKDGCIVSRALAGVPEITVTAKLAS
jgi:osmotically inducible protein OsmC